MSAFNSELSTISGMQAAEGQLLHSQPCLGPSHKQAMHKLMKHILSQRHGELTRMTVKGMSMQAAYRLTPVRAVMTAAPPRMSMADTCSTGQ